jgi:predicted nucleic acid-binding protein
LKPIYLDTSLVVASLVHEPGTAKAHQFLQDAAERPWLISNWLETELASALAMQCRRGTIQIHERDEAWMRFHELREAKMLVVLPEPADFAAAARLCLAGDPPIRAGDALHLAICMRSNGCLASFDKELCAAASHHHVLAEHLLIKS